ncbi:MAG: 4-alpha-glucanotransferase [Eubacteriales bacterium]|nr:4-alpha-glucanotransferase [Eubacteriales bacterium]
MRECGILFPVFSLPSRFGIGCFSKEAYEFVDFLKESGQRYWQVLPLGPTGYGDSPYQPLSAFAGNPYFIDLDTLIREGLLKEEEAASAFFGNDQEKVDYGAMYENRKAVLHKAFVRFKESAEEETEYKAFIKKNKYWLEDYALFRAMKHRHQQKSWLEWDEEFRLGDERVMACVAEEESDLIEFYYFMQYEFRKQWDALHEYAAEKGIKIIGDIPFYMSMDSADAWAHPEVFRFDKEMKPESVAGCPPDAFSPVGQLWGNPLYNWAKEKRSGYAWWTQRLAYNLELFDVLRFDHFHGFAEYYEIPYGDENALNGTMKEGPGIAFFRSVRKKLGDFPAIAEDLGVVTPLNSKLLEDSGFPGMNVLQFAFDGSESSWYLPYRHKTNSVVYTGTHDNTTARAWIEGCNDHDRDYVRRYINSVNTDYGAFVWDLIREAYRSTADTCIIPLQDFLVKGEEARINTPGTQGANWCWRLQPNFLSGDLARSIYGLAKLYGRLPKEPVKQAEEEAEEEKKTDKTAKDKKEEKAAK